MSAFRSAGVRAIRIARTRPLTRTYAAGPVPPEWDEPYPKLPDVNKQHRSPYGWWDPQLRRNLGELPHEREEMYSMWGPDVPHVEPKTALRHFIIATGLFVTFGFACSYLLTPVRDAIPREYPFDGLVREMGGLGDNAQRTERVDDDE
ncbi:hypothetical protein K488DRAFT_77386 [Vararia minispora EC-137]|uniref:Uncharacterized protein n=1 Tax=Vararia minispora EC-137 TaxID=1314806 RepID=A0ACB8QS19_9AGAM|nr:hypothetical protein K488DRAFT_77386 [Vararia minispora EC-137]